MLTWGISGDLTRDVMGGKMTFVDIPGHMQSVLAILRTTRRAFGQIGNNKKLSPDIYIYILQQAKI